MLHVVGAQGSIYFNYVCAFIYICIYIYVSIYQKSRIKQLGILVGLLPHLWRSGAQNEVEGQALQPAARLLPILLL